MSADAFSYIDSKNDDQRKTMYQLIKVIRDLLPHLELKKSWGLPYFYYKQKPLCYLQIKSGETDISLEVNGGAELATIYRELTGDGTVIRHLIFPPQVQINEPLLRAVLQDAAMLIDEKLHP